LIGYFFPVLGLVDVAYDGYFHIWG